MASSFTQGSPSVDFREIDLTNIVGTTGVSGGAFAGNFAWGPVEEITTVSSPLILEQTFGKPDDTNYVDWFSAFNFLAYTDDLKIVRAADEDAINSTDTGTGILIKNSQHFEVVRTAPTSVKFASKYPGSIGDSVAVYIADSATFEEWEYANLFESAPGTSSIVAAHGGSNDELHVVITDNQGRFTGVVGAVLETFPFLSKALDAKDANNAPNYYVNVLNRASRYVWALNVPTGDELEETGADWGTQSVVAGVPQTYKSLIAEIAAPLTGGADSTAISSGDLITAYSMFENQEEVDVSLIFMGAAGGETEHQTTVQYVIDNIAEVRRDCVVFFSPNLSDVLNKTQSQAVQDVIETRNGIARSTSYAVMDCGWKLQYDMYNDVYRWVPLNADIAGLCALVDSTNDPWVSPGGYTRGRLRNVVSLAFNPNKTSRDALYKAGVNLVVTFNVDGTVLYSDKTLLGKNSAFGQIGVRRLFIMLQKSISNAAKYFLFETNNEFTRASFVNMVTPHLEQVRGRGGIEDFRVIADETNNGPEVRMNRQFVGSIFIKPVYSIQWIQLNFVAVRQDVSFDEIVGGTF